MFTCHECKQAKPLHEHYDNDGKLTTSHMIARNSARTWEYEYCHTCWTALTMRAFCAITREGDRVIATTVF